MKSFVITGGLTKAYAARDILIKKGIKAIIKRQANNLKRIGCGYGVVTTTEGLGVLEKTNIKILGVINLE